MRNYSLRHSFLLFRSALQCVNRYVLFYRWTPERMFAFAVVYSSSTNWWRMWVREHNK